MTTAPFIVFEGPEGAGKTTQLNRLATSLREGGYDPLVTREPGGSDEGEALRALLLDHSMDWSATAELLLMNAARDAHLRKAILPALEAGRPVLCDRFAASSRAYQGGGGGVPKDVVRSVEAAVVSRRPDLTLIFDLPVSEGLARAGRRGRADRFEEKGHTYHDRVRDTFLAIARTDPTAVLIDASGGPDDVHAAVKAALRTNVPSLLPIGAGS